MMTPQPDESVAEIDLMQTGGFGVRFGARVIDSVVSIGIGSLGGGLGAIAAAVLAAMGKIGPDWLAKSRASGTFWLSVLWGILAGLLYHSISEGVAGASVGKLILGYRVVQEDLRPCTIGSAVVRSLAYYVDAFFFGLPAYYSMHEGRNQRLGDKWARTPWWSKPERCLPRRGGATRSSSSACSVRSSPTPS